MRAGRYWSQLEPVVDDGGELVHVASGEIARAVVHGRPGASGRVGLGGAGGSRTSVSQPARVWMRTRIATLMGVEGISDQDDRDMQFPLRPVPEADYASQHW